MVKLGTIEDAAEAAELKALIEKHLEHTGSDVAQELLEDWDKALEMFVRVMPTDYERMQNYMKEAKATGDYETDYDVAVAAFDMHLDKVAQAKKAQAEQAKQKAEAV
jgi:glutamate synthase (NADPH/NADH) large chain